MKYKLLSLCLLSLLVFLAFYYYQSRAFLYFLRDHQVIKVALKDHFFSSSKRELMLEVVNTPASLARGLSSRSDLHSETGQKIDGLLFIMPSKSLQQFWMKDMLFDLDICWLADLNFLSCQRMAKAPLQGQEPVTFRSSAPANLVLETRPGELSEEDLSAKLFFAW
jgi:uncharacterized membrane protein (UPF0127 family)